MSQSRDRQNQKWDPRLAASSEISILGNEPTTATASICIYAYVYGIWVYLEWSGMVGCGWGWGCSGDKLVSVQGTKLVGWSSPNPSTAVPQRLFNTILFGSFLISMESILLPFRSRQRGGGLKGWGSDQVAPLSSRHCSEVGIEKSSAQGKRD